MPSSRRERGRNRDHDNAPVQQARSASASTSTTASTSTSAITASHSDAASVSVSAATPNSSSRRRPQALGSSSRAGQACNRCKQRKIKCDQQPGRCGPCRANDAVCETTDRLTGQANPRGHVDRLESENAALRSYIDMLAPQLLEHAIRPHPPPASLAQYGPLPSFTKWASMSSASTGGILTELPQDTTMTQRQIPQPVEGSSTKAPLLGACRSARLGDTYSGISGNEYLSTIEGTSLSLFGAKIDLADFLPSDEDNAGFVVSYEDFLDYSTLCRRQDRPSAPDSGEAQQYAMLFFLCVSFFTPVIHKPDLYALLERFYQQTYQPNTSEEATLHLVFSTVGFQMAIRNRDLALRDKAKAHFLYSLSFVPELEKRRDVQDMQALTLICVLLRSLQRPGPACLFVRRVLGIAIELGWHRSIRAWRNDGSAETHPHTAEIRKRVFWTLLVLHVGISGKMGRPMLLRHEDFDVEIPESIPDNLPHEELPEWSLCSFRPAEYGFKLTHIQLRVYSTIYAIRPVGSSYDANVRQLEVDLRDFEASVPKQISTGPETAPNDLIPALYLQLGINATRLLIHHPALLSPKTSYKVANDNLVVCLSATSKILHIANELNRLRSIDTTIYYNMDFLSAILVTLFASLERCVHWSADDMEQLRQDMDVWLAILGDVGEMLGSGLRLQTAVRRIVDATLSRIDKIVADKTAQKAAIPANSPPTHPLFPHHQSQFSYQAPGPSQYNDAFATASTSHDADHPSQHTLTMPHHSSVAAAHPRNSYPPNLQYQYAAQTGQQYPQDASTSYQQASGSGVAHHRDIVTPQSHIPPNRTPNPAHLEGYGLAHHQSFAAPSEQSNIAGSVAWDGFSVFSNNIMHDIQSAGHPYGATHMETGIKTEVGGVDMPLTNYENMQMPRQGAEWSDVNYGGAGSSGGGGGGGH